MKEPIRLGCTERADVHLGDRFAIAHRCGGAKADAYGKAVSISFDSPKDAFAHYLAAGRAASPDMFPFLDLAYYEQQLGSRIPEATTLFEHYAVTGAEQGTSPMALYDPRYIAAQCETAPPADVFDYISQARYAGVDPHPLFSKQYYRAINIDVAKAATDPFFHFVHHGWRERRAFHPFFRH